MSLFAAEATTTRFLLGSRGTVIESVKADGTIASIKSALTSGLRWDFVQAADSGGQGPIYAVNGSDAPQQWTGSGSMAAWTASAGTVPNGKFMVYAGNRVWVAGVASDPSALFFCELGDPRNWPAANVVRFDPKDGEEITGIGTVGPYLLVFKDSKAWVVFNLDTGANRRLGEGVGCISHRSITPSPEGTYFLALDGCYVTNGSNLQRLSDRVKPTLDNLVGSMRQQVRGRYFDNHFFLSFADSGIHNTKVLDYDTRSSSWWLHSPGFDDMAVWEPSAGSTALYGANGNLAAVSRLFSAGTVDDNGAAVTAYWKGAFHTFSTPALRKRVRMIHFDGQGQIVPGFATDFTPVDLLEAGVSFSPAGTTFGGAGTYGGDGVFGDPVNVGEAAIYTPGVARAWSVLFANNQPGQSFEVDSYTFAVNPPRKSGKPQLVGVA